MQFGRRNLSWLPRQQLEAVRALRGHVSAGDSWRRAWKLKQTSGITSMYTLCASTIIEGPSLARPPVAALSALRTSVVIQKHHTYHNNG